MRKKTSNHCFNLIAASLLLVLWPSLVGCPAKSDLRGSSVNAGRDASATHSKAAPTDATQTPAEAVSITRNANRGYSAADANRDAEIGDQAWTFCADCHAMPLPSSFSRERWAHEVQRGFDFYFASGRADLAVPKMSDIKQYFESKAPGQLILPEPLPLDPQVNTLFQKVELPRIAEIPESVAGASLQVIDWGAPVGKRLVQADMRGGALVATQYDPAQVARTGFGASEVIARLQNPCRFVLCDLEGTDMPGLLVADLGSFQPADHSRGRVVWLRRTSKEILEFEPVVLLENCGRVADVKVRDLDGDGDLDIVVAEFGWHETGRLLWLENNGTSSHAGLDASSFTPHVLDARPGAMECEVVDVDGDGHLDIVALIAQEFEQIVAFLGDGKGGFVAKELYSAPDPAYGSSGMAICDFDGDGDLDIIYTNGDSFDSFQAKPYHAVHWLENHGQLQFEDHILASLPGAHRALPVDIDQDGDLDLIACAFLPENMLNDFPSGAPMAVIWIENRGDGNFLVRPLKTGSCTHPAICLEDLDEDGRADIAVTNFSMDAAAEGPAIDVWLNRSGSSVVDFAKNPEPGK